MGNLYPLKEKTASFITVMFKGRLALFHCKGTIFFLTNQFLLELLVKLLNNSYILPFFTHDEVHLHADGLSSSHNRFLDAIHDIAHIIVRHIISSDDAFVRLYFLSPNLTVPGLTITITITMTLLPS